MTEKLCIMLGDVCVPDPMPFPPDVCKVLPAGSTCPLGSGKQYDETVTLSIPKDIPGVSNFVYS